MGRPRAFDHDKARAMRADGMTYAAIAHVFGVAPQSVQIAVNPAHRERYKAWQKENRPWVGVCSACGGPATKRFNAATRTGLCRTCWNDNRIGDACPAGHPREDNLYRQPTGRVRCRACEREARRLYRLTHPKKREQENARRRERHSAARAAA